MKKYSLFLTVSGILTAASTFAQTPVVLIDPTGDGGFETGTSFAANGWTEVNPTGNRIWYVGTGQLGFTGSRAAFIGNNATTVGAATAARTVHFYRSVTFPAGATNFQLTFKYKQATADYSASATPAYADYVAVYTAAAAPTAGNLPSGTLQFGPYPSASVPSFTTQTVTLPNSVAGTTTNLIFTFRCDNVAPHGYGAVDDVSLSYTPPPACSGTPTAGTIASTAATLCSGGAATLSLSGATVGYSGLTYQWKSATASSGPFTAVATGGTSETYATGALAQTTYYTADVSCGASTATTPVYTLTVNPLPTASASPATASICSGSTQAFTAATSAAAPSYVWKRNNTVITGATDPSYAASTAGSYTVTATDGATGCSTTSAAAVLTVLNGPAITVSPTTATLTCGGTPVALTAASNYYSSTQLSGEDFNNGLGSFTASTLTSHTAGAFLLYTSGYTYAAQTLTYTTPDASRFVMVNSDSTGTGQKQRIFLTSPAYNTTGQNLVGVVLNHFYQKWSSGDSAVQVQASLDGTSWTVEADILAQGNRGSASAFAVDTFVLSNTYANKPTVYIRVLYATTFGYYYALNDFKLLGLVPATYTWTPTQGLYTDAAATVPYAATPTTTVYAKPNSTTSYFVNVSNGTCSGSIGRSVTVTDPAGMTLATASTGSQTLHTNTGTANTISVRNEACELVAAVKPNAGTPIRGFVRSKLFLDATVPTVNGTPYVQRHYEITPDTGAAGATGTVTLYATQAEFNAYNSYVTANGLSLPLLPTGGTDNSNVRITKKSGTSTTGTPGGYTPGVATLITPTTVTWNATGNGGAGQWEIVFSTTGFSGFFIHTTSSGNPLPLAALSIAAAAQDAGVRVRWSTTSEVSVASFTVERSQDGRSFDALTAIPAAALDDYQYLDTHPLAGRSFYRIRATDRNGSVAYSAVAPVTVGTRDLDVAVVPNPATRTCTVLLTGTDAATTAHIEVTDATGRVLRAVTTGAARTDLDLTGLPAGLYLVRCTCEGVVKTCKLTKQD